MALNAWFIVFISMGNDFLPIENVISVIHYWNMKNRMLQYCRGIKKSIVVYFFN